MQIRMLKTESGSIDGIRVQSYVEGVEYDLSQTAGARDLAQAFVGADLAEEVGAQKLAPADPDPDIAADAGDSPAAPAKAGRKTKSQ